MKKVFSFVKGKKDDKKESKLNPPISVEITNPSGQKITSDDEHIIGLQQGFGYNVDINGRDKNLSKLHKAAWFGNLEKVKLLAKKIDVNSLDWAGRSPLHLAVAQGHTETAWFLLNNNASITLSDAEGLTPFLKAVECGHKDCTNLLIECGVDIKATDKHGNTGLHIAARSGFYNIASLLLKEGTSLNLPNNVGDYPLHLATTFDHREMVEQLLKTKAHGQVDVTDREGRSPLMLAARSGLAPIIRVLLDAGASTELVDSNGWTAEDYAQIGGHHELVDLLKVEKKSGETGVPLPSPQQPSPHPTSAPSVPAATPAVPVAAPGTADSLTLQSSAASENIIPSESGVSGGAVEEGGGPTTEDSTTDSPKSCVIPPPLLEPPKSWELIQSGAIDQESSDVRRRNLMTLGGLQRNAAGEEGGIELTTATGSSTDFLPVVLTPTGETIPAEMRLSPEPPGRTDRAPTPERRTRSPLERALSLDLPSDQESPLLTPEKAEGGSMFKELTESTKPPPPPTDLNDNAGEAQDWTPESNNNNVTLDKLDNVIKPESEKNINQSSPPPESYYMTFGELSKERDDPSTNLLYNKSVSADEMNGEERTCTLEYSQSFDNLDERSYCTENAFTGVSSSFDNLEDMEEKTMSIEIIQSTGKLDDTLAVCTFQKCKFRETHSLEILDDPSDSRSHKNKRHSRNKSITLQGQPQLWKSADLIPKSSSFEKCTNIDAQLECYDEALRQLAKVNILKSAPPPPPENEEETFSKSSQTSFPEPRQDCSFSRDDSFPQVHDIEPISLDFPPEVLENEPDSLDPEREVSFPPPPTYFMESEDTEIMHINTVEACLQTMDINLPLPISMLTPIKENHFESDSLSNVEGADGEGSEASTVESDNLARKNSLTPSHFNVEVIVNTKSASTSPTSDNTPLNEVQLQNFVKSDSSQLDDSDDVFLQDEALPEHYQKYFVDVRALQIHPDQIDFTKVMMPNDSPSPESLRKNSESPEVNNSPVEQNGIPKNKFPSLNFDIGGIVNVKSPSSYTQLESGETETGGRPLRRRRKLLTTMREAEPGGGMEGQGGEAEGRRAGPETQRAGTESEAEESERDSTETDSEEDPPFWQSTQRGGFFVRQNTVVTSRDHQSPTSITIPGPSHLSRGFTTPPGSSEAETASASDTPKRSPQCVVFSSSYLSETRAESGLLQDERAATLEGAAERLQYQLEDCRQAEASREDTIASLQAQLARLEYRYTKAQEEICTLRQRAVSAEQELEHLREICLNLSTDKSQGHHELNAYLETQQNFRGQGSAPHRSSSSGNIHMLMRHLEEEKRLEEDKNRRLVQHLEEVLLTNRSMVGEREALIAQNIADVRKLQEDTICWKERYEECAAKLELMDKRQDPRLLEAQDTIATLKRTIAILQQEKTAYGKLYDVSTSSTASPRKGHPSLPEPSAAESPCVSSSGRKETRSLPTDVTLAFLLRELKACQLLIQTSCSGAAELTATTPDSIIGEDAKVAELQQKIKNEITKRELLENQMKRILNELQQKIEVCSQLDGMHRKLEKEFVSRKEMEELKCQTGEALERIKKEVAVESDSKLSLKLAEINTLIQSQMKEQTRLEQIRTNSESSIKQEFENISNTLQIELGKIQTALKAKEINEIVLLKKCKEMEEEIRRSRDYSRSLSSEEEIIKSQNGGTKPQGVKVNVSTTGTDSTTPAHSSDKQIKGLIPPTLEEKFTDELKEKYHLKK